MNDIIREGVFVLLKKIFALGLGVCCLFIFNQADAWEYDKKAIMKEFIVNLVMLYLMQKIMQLVLLLR